METKCPACAVRMHEGFVPDHHENTTRLGVWVEGPPEFSWLGNLKIGYRPQYALRAYRCPQCGFVQLFAIDRLPN